MEIKWEPSEGKSYAILYKKMIEVFDVKSEKPLSDFIFQTAATSFDFIGPDAICVSDEIGCISILKNVLAGSSELRYEMFQTKFARIREVKTCFSQTLSRFLYLGTISTDQKVAIWSIPTLIDYKSSEEEEQVKAMKVIKSKSRLTCLAINCLIDDKRKNV